MWEKMMMTVNYAAMKTERVVLGSFPLKVGLLILGAPAIVCYFMSKYLLSGSDVKVVHH